MAMQQEQMLCVQLERLRVLFTLLAVVPDGLRRDELVRRARGAVADIRKIRTALADNKSDDPDAGRSKLARSRCLSGRHSRADRSSRSPTTGA